MEEILRYFPFLNPFQISQFEQLASLYSDWNDKINVISRKDISHLYTHHVLHSLAIAKFLDPIEGTKFIDLGTGGGFPGIPLAILFPGCNFHLIDRIGKKITVARDVAEKIGLENVTFQHGDIGECHEKFDFCVSRAVMSLPELVKCVRKNISALSKNNIGNGLICLKGGDLTEETKAVKYPVMDIFLSEYFSDDYFKTKQLIYVKI